MITHKELKEYLHYDPNTGVMFSYKNRKRTNYLFPLGSVATNKYLLINISDFRYRAHRLAWLYVYGEFPKGQIDHINGNRIDNRICNLRDVSRNENAKNKSMYKNNTSGVSGISWDKINSKWSVYIKDLHIGSYKCKLDAVAEVIRARKKHGFHSNHGRWQLYDV